VELKELITKNRSYRRFNQYVNIERRTLVELVNLARLSPSAANLQPLKYIISCEQETNESIFGTLAWAGYLKEWPGPCEGEKPSAYIVILGDTTITENFHCDHGIASQSILLGATEKGLGGCILGAIKRENLRKALNISRDFEILLIIALGKTNEKVQLETKDPGGDIKYWRDEQDIHHVPKRPLEEIILTNENTGGQ